MRSEVLGNCCVAACVARHVGRHRGVRGCDLTDAGFQRLFVYLWLSTDSNPLVFFPLSGCRCLEVASGHMEREMITTTDTQRLEVCDHALAEETVVVRESFARVWHIGIGFLHGAYRKVVILVRASAPPRPPHG